MGWAGTFIISSLAAALLVAGTASAQLPSDPDPGSPPGRVYELPVGTGRDDGAPRSGSSGADSAASERQASSYRSENNFGTSSIVPGDPRSGRGGNGGTGKQGAGPVLAATVLETGETSVGRSYLLLALIAGVGVLLGVVSGRRRAAG